MSHPGSQPIEVITMVRLLWKRAWSAVRQARGASTPTFPLHFAALYAYKSRRLA